MLPTWSKVTFISALILTGFNTALASQNRLDLSSIEATPHEIALTQALSEICPPMLNLVQRVQFAKAYKSQLEEFMPKLDTTLVMKQLSEQREYRAILDSIREWTMNFPKDENKALCVEFAESHSIVTKSKPNKGGQTF